MDPWLVVVTWLERGVLGLLFGLSIWSVAIMIDRKKRFTVATIGGTDILDSMPKGQSSESQAKVTSLTRPNVELWVKNNSSAHAGTLRVALNLKRDSSPETIDRSVRAFLTQERLDLEKGLSVLATLGANAPFIGLFGTVLGIIRAFAALAGNSTEGAASVMSGISLALVATAAGLFVAIPAVVAFNVFSNRLRNVMSQCEALKDHFVAQLQQER